MDLCKGYATGSITAGIQVDNLTVGEVDAIKQIMKKVTIT